ncbi:hypothetical protein THAOC_24230, partial [Thalassiosira oceanica]
MSTRSGPLLLGSSFRGADDDDGGGAGTAFSSCEASFGSRRPMGAWHIFHTLHRGLGDPYPQAALKAARKKALLIDQNNPDYFFSIRVVSREAPREMVDKIVESWLFGVSWSAPLRCPRPLPSGQCPSKSKRTDYRQAHAVALVPQLLNRDADPGETEVRQSPRSLA